ncbi:MAG: AraC family transcriptional regulator, partial [Clostridia bacterium]
MVETELCGKFMLEDNFCHMKRKMIYNELILMTEGEMYICEDDADFYTVKKGDMLFLKSGRVHRGFKNSTGPVSFFWFHYTSDEETYNNLVPHFTPSETAYIAQLYNQ